MSFTAVEAQGGRHRLSSASHTSLQNEAQPAVIGVDLESLLPAWFAALPPLTLTSVRTGGLQKSDPVDHFVRSARSSLLSIVHLEQT